MPKAVWGKGLSMDDIDSAESRDFTPYDGPLPTRGVFGAVVKRMTYMKKNSNGNPMLKLLLIVDGSVGKDKAKYDGAPVWDQLVVMKSSAWKVKDFCAAIGVTSADFLNGMVIDEEGVVTKIGPKKAEGLTLKFAGAPDTNQNGDPRAIVGKYMPAGGAEETATEGKKAKKGKKSAEADEDAPF